MISPWYPCTIFADDLSIVVYKKSRLNLEVEIKETIDRVVNWLKCNNLQVNLCKITFLHFLNHNKTPENLFIAHNKNPVTESTTAKILGLLLDRTCRVGLRKNQQTCTRTLAVKKYLWPENCFDSHDHAYVCSTRGMELLSRGTLLPGIELFLQKKYVRVMCGVVPRDSCKPLSKKEMYSSMIVLSYRHA